MVKSVVLTFWTYKSYEDETFAGDHDLLHHCARVPVKYMFFNLLHPVNAPSPRLVTLLGMVIDVKLVQFWNAFFPILVTLVGIVTDVILVQPEKV